MALSTPQKRSPVPGTHITDQQAKSYMARLFPKPAMLRGVRDRAWHLAGTITATVKGTVMDETTTQEATMMVKKAKPKTNPRRNGVDEVRERVVAV